jgi:hypothetical protein
VNMVEQKWPSNESTLNPPPSPATSQTDYLYLQIPSSVIGLYGILRRPLPINTREHRLFLYPMCFRLSWVFPPEIIGT